MAPIATKLRQNAFRTIPDISFFDRHFFSKLRTAVYPPRMAPIGFKLRENEFQVIPDISFFDGANTFCDQFFCCKHFSSTAKNFFSKVPVLEELCRFTHQCQMQLENSLPELPISAFYDPWRRGKMGKNCFCREFWPKKLMPYSFFEISFTFVCESQARVPRVNLNCYLRFFQNDQKLHKRYKLHCFPVQWY